MSWLRGIAACTLWLVATSAGAQAPAAEPHGIDRLEQKLDATRKTIEAARERAHARFEAIARRAEQETVATAKELRDSMQDARAQGKQVLSEAKQAVTQAGDRLKSALDDVKSVGNRASRTQAARRSAWQRFAGRARQPSDIPDSARIELRIHARRMARLSRVRALAEYEHDQALIQRTDALSEREQTRHRAALARAWPPSNDSRLRAIEEDDPEVRSREDEDEQDNEP